ncbi:MAG: hypothetical protein KGD59_08710 [Candidatus Heimdallarchaeota archaeon]|nr:hypothetical protein [Candidatus Heimdallarchaeota archaeon]MBY8994617.1 hypothetical protein [Candidatus Heimdallarchaeota archaeon]
MSENIDCNLSLGVTETGNIGEDIIIGILSVEKENEIILLVNNLLYSNHIVNLLGVPINKKTRSDMLDTEITKRYIANLMRNNKVGLSLFRLQPHEQFKLLQKISILEGQKLYEIGKSLDSSNYQYIGKALQLRYQYPKLFVETFIKSLIQYTALNWMIRETDCGHAELFKQNILDERRMALHIIINGGAQYSSYQDILNDNLKNFWNNIKTTEASKFYWNLMVATHGIENAKSYYPVVSTVDFVTSNLATNINNFLYTGNTLHEIAAENLITQTDHVGKTILEELHDHYLERTGSTFRPPKLWRIGDFTDLGEYELTLPYLMLQKSIKEKKITAREVDDDINNIERFYQYNNPLERDAFIIGKIKEKDKLKIDALKDLGIEGTTVVDESLIEEYRALLNDIGNYVQQDDCIITSEDQKAILGKIASFEKTDFKKIEKVKIPTNVL